MTSQGPGNGLPPLREVIARHGLTARRALGQNFLLDLNLCRRIARAAGALEGQTVLEVGPGPGGLTRSLLDEGAARVVAVEADPRAVAALAELAEAYSGRLEIIEGDALNLDVAKLVKGPVKVVANLPYNIATPLLAGWLSADDWPPWFESLTLTFQKEVAERISAPPGSKTYGRLSILGQWRCNVVRHFDIPAKAFVPAPKVTSTVIGLTPLTVPRAEADADCLSTVVAAAFGQRRKMLRSALKVLEPNMGDNAAKLLEVAQIDPTRRAEELSVEEFCALARAYSTLGAAAQ